MQTNRAQQLCKAMKLMSLWARAYGVSRVSHKLCRERIMGTSSALGLIFVSAVMASLPAQAQGSRWAQAQTYKNSYPARMEYLERNSWSAHSRNGRGMSSSRAEALAERAPVKPEGYPISAVMRFREKDPAGFRMWMYQTALYQLGTREAVFNAVRGNATAEFKASWGVLLAQMYLAGDGTPKNPAAAVEALQGACAAGNATACADVGFFRLEGQHVAKDEAEGIQWLTRAADQGQAIAAARLAAAYHLGLYAAAPADATKAVLYARVAADGGEAYGQYILGLALVTGDGTERDEAKGLDLLKTAARAGQEHAQKALKAAGESW